MYEEAIAAHHKAIEANPEGPFGVQLAHAYAVAGRRTEARETLLKLGETTRRRFAPWVAGVHAVLGEEEQAFRWLEVAYDERDGCLPMIRTTAGFDALRDDARFQDLLRRMNLPE
jgi:hypothetical protein